MGTDGAEIVGIFFNPFVHKSVVARDINTSKRFEGWTEFMIVEKGIRCISNQ